MPSTRTGKLILTFQLDPDEPPELIKIEGDAAVGEKHRMSDVEACRMEWESDPDIFFPDEMPHGEGELTLTGNILWDESGTLDYGPEYETLFERE